MTARPGAKRFAASQDRIRLFFSPAGGWRRSLAAKPGGEAWRLSASPPAACTNSFLSHTHTHAQRTHAQTLTHSLTHTRTQVLDRLRGLLQSAVAADVEKGEGGDAGADVLCVVYTGCAQKHSGR